MAIFISETRDPTTPRALSMSIRAGYAPVHSMGQQADPIENDLDKGIVLCLEQASLPSRHRLIKERRAP
jgi:hypothetical protein